MCLSYSQIKASQGPHSLNVFCHSTNISTSASLLLQYKPLRGTWRYLKIRIFSRNQKKKGYAIIYALKIHWVCSKRGINKKIHRPSGLTTLSLKKRSEGCLGSYFSVGFFFFGTYDEMQCVALDCHSLLSIIFRFIACFALRHLSHFSVWVCL